MRVAWVLGENEPTTNTERTPFPTESFRAGESGSRGFAEKGSAAFRVGVAEGSGDERRNEGSLRSADRAGTIGRRQCPYGRASGLLRVGARIRGFNRSDAWCGSA